jgi:regulatory Fis family protein
VAAVYERGGEWLAVPRPIPLRRVVRSAILNALAYTDGHQAEAAAWLGLTVRQFSYSLKVYDVPGKSQARRTRRTNTARRRGQIWGRSGSKTGAIVCPPFAPASKVLKRHDFQK